MFLRDIYDPSLHISSFHRKGIFSLVGGGDIVGELEDFLIETIRGDKQIFSQCFRRTVSVVSMISPRYNTNICIAASMWKIANDILRHVKIGKISLRKWLTREESADFLLAVFAKGLYFSGYDGFIAPFCTKSLHKNLLKIILYQVDNEYLSRMKNRQDIEFNSQNILYLLGDDNQSVNEKIMIMRKLFFNGKFDIFRMYFMAEVAFYCGAMMDMDGRKIYNNFKGIFQLVEISPLSGSVDLIISEEKKDRANCIMRDIRGLARRVETCISEKLGHNYALAIVKILEASSEEEKLVFLREGYDISAINLEEMGLKFVPDFMLQIRPPTSDRYMPLNFMLCCDKK